MIFGICTTAIILSLMAIAANLYALYKERQVYQADSRAWSDDGCSCYGCQKEAGL